jgi:sugar lactone lactonase YvrE
MRAARFLLALLLAAPAARGSAGAAEIEPVPLLEELSFPTNMAFTPDGRLLFTEKETGAVRVVTPRGELLDRPFVTLPVIPDAERGLLGIAVHPDFERSPWVYLYHSDPADGRNRLVRVLADGSVSSGAPSTLLDGVTAAAGYHNGGDLAFGSDGTLFVSLGEAHDPGRAQDERDIGGKILRLTPDGRVPAGAPFGRDNPVWSLGHRNSFGLCVAPATGQLWETENGPDRDDEVNLVEAGGNYGWPAVTGRGDDGRWIDPVAVFAEPIAPTGCAVVGDTLWFGSFDGRLWRMPTSGGSPAEAASFPSGVTDVAFDRGRLYVATADSIWTIDLRAGATATTAPTPGGASPGPPPSPRDETEDGAGRSWVAAAAFVALAGALGVRFVAGRRSRRRRPDPPT